MWRKGTQRSLESSRGQDGTHGFIPTAKLGELQKLSVELLKRKKFRKKKVVLGHLHVNECLK